MARRPPSRHPDRGSPGGGYPDGGYPGDGYASDGYAGDGYPSDGYVGDGYAGDGYAAGDCSGAGRGDVQYRDAWYQDVGYLDDGYRARGPGGHAERRADDRGGLADHESWDRRGGLADYGSWDSREDWDGRRTRDQDDNTAWRGDSRGSRVREPHGGRASGTRTAWDGQEPERRARDDRGDRAGDRAGWSRDPEAWAGERGDLAGKRGDWAGQDCQSWDVGVWGSEDENLRDGGYRRTVHRDTTGGAEGNERLTALVGALLLVLFAAEGVTILSVRQLLTLHFFLGMLLVGPVVLKACSVLYRFARYYTGAPEYRRKGPPAPLLRVLGPVVLITSLSVIGTGIMLAITGPSGLGTWLFLHRASFIMWFGAMTVHVLAYVWRLPRLVSGDLAIRAGRRAREVLAGRPARWLLLTASLLTGLLLAVLTVHSTGVWYGPGK